MKGSRLITYALLIFLSISLGSCKTRPPAQPTAGTDMVNILQNSIDTDNALMAKGKKGSMSISNALLPPLSVPTPNGSQSAERRFNVAANSVPAKAFFMSLVAGTHYNMLIDPDTKGTITLNLKNVTIREALDAVRELYGYDYKRIPTGYEIIPPTMRTQIFSVNYLDISRIGKSQTQLVSTDITEINNGNTSSSGTTGSTVGQMPNQAPNQILGSGSMVQTKSDSHFWKGLAATLKTLIGTQEGRWVIVDPQASTVMIHAYPKEIYVAGAYLDHIQKSLQREVIIEAKILEIELDDSYQAGIDWKALGLIQNGASTGYTPFTSGGFITLSSSAGGGDHQNFTTMIQLLESQGNVQVLSSPHVSTVNNQEAVIKVGQDEFFVTGYTSNITPTGSTNTTSQSVQLTPFFSGITLDVTPQISAQGEIILYIHPSVSTVKDQNKTIQLSGTGSTTNDVTLPLAQSTIRESDSVVHAHNGQIIVIGGLMQHKTSENIDATPGLSKIPFAGAAARNTEQVSKKSELIILLKPIVVDNATWPKQIQDSAGRVRTLNKRGFHFGSLPKVFGDQAESDP